MTDIYYPAGPVNTIGTWDSQSAYKVKMSAAATLPVIGNEETNKTLTLSAGWNLIPVICNYPVDAAATLAPLDLEVAKDVAGTGVYWPDMSINTLDNLNPGMAYYALLNAAGSFTYPANTDEPVTVNPATVEIPENPWNSFAPTGTSHLIALVADGMQGIEKGDVIGVFSPQGNCYGATRIVNTQQNALLTACADDMTTGEKDGFETGDLFSLKLYRPATGEVFTLNVIFSTTLPNVGEFAPDGLSAVTSLKVSSTGIAGIPGNDIGIYPNPTNGRVWITGVNGFTELTLFNNTGRVLLQRSDLGQDKISLDLSGFSNGIYQLRLTGNNGTAFRKIVKD